MRKRIDAGHLRAGCPGLFLRVVGDDLRQWSVQRRTWLGILLHERWSGRYDMSVKHEPSDPPSDLRRRGQWLHFLHDHYLLERSLYWPSWLGLVLHERMHGWSDLPVEYEHSDLRGRSQWLHCQHHIDLHQRNMQRSGWLGGVHRRMQLNHLSERVL